MKGVFGMLLIGGGIVLLFGELTGKITFPFTPAQPTSTSSTTPSIGTPNVTSQGLATAQRKGNE
jgi:hypothetical protein